MVPTEVHDQHYGVPRKCHKLRTSHHRRCTLVDLQELQKVEKEIVPVFVVDKYSSKICAPQKTIKSLTSLGIELQRVARGTGYFMWNVLLPPADWEDISSRDLIKKDLILITEYTDRHRTKVSVYEVPHLVIGKHLATYLAQFVLILSASSDDLNVDWSFEIMIDHKAFTSFPNCLYVQGRKCRSLWPVINQPVGSVAGLVTSLIAQRIKSLDFCPPPTQICV